VAEGARLESELRVTPHASSNLAFSAKLKKLGSSPLQGAIGFLR
jgi:hypothetical protein